MIKILFLLLTLIPTILATQQSEQAPEATKTLLKKVEDINMRSFPIVDDHWSCYSFVEFLMKYRPRRFNPSPDKKRKDAYTLFADVEKKQTQKISVPLNDESTWLDLELFAGKKPGAPFFTSMIDRTLTEYGKVKLCWMFAQPTDNHELLVHRQNTIKILSRSPDAMEQLNQQLMTVQKTENIFLSFWAHDDIKRDLEGGLLPIKSLNEKKSLLFFMGYTMHMGNITNLSIATFATGSLAVYGALRACGMIDESKFNTVKKEHQGAGGLGISFFWKKMEQLWPTNRSLQVTFALASAVMCGFGIKRMVDMTQGMYMLDCFVHELMHQVSQTMNALREINKILLKHPELSHVAEFKPLFDLFASKDKKIIEFMKLMDAETLRKKPSFIGHKGVVLRSFFLMHEVKEELVLAVDAIAGLDVYVSFAKLYQEFSSKRVHWCFADYALAETPFINVKNFWHPMVNENVVIPNSVQLGINDQALNLVITGPNAGGKSTILKALALNILLAQTFGVVPAEQFTLTPFTSIATYLNITDDIGAGNSLYKAEVLRVVELMKRIDSLRTGKFSFALFDEVFNGTSPREGSVAAFSIVDDLAKKKNSLNLVATHFELLTRLSERNDRVMNYKVSVNVHENGIIEYPFKLEPGISHQHVAIDILRNEGVSTHILDQATTMLRSMSF